MCSEFLFQGLESPPFSRSDSFIMSSGFFMAEPTEFLLVYSKLKKGKNEYVLSTLGINLMQVIRTKDLVPSAKQRVVWLNLGKGHKHKLCEASCSGDYNQPPPQNTSGLMLLNHIPSGTKFSFYHPPLTLQNCIRSNDLTVSV